MEKKIIRQRLRMLRTAMREEKIDYYLIPTADYHNSEYVNDYFKAREFLSGFTGSNGTLVVSLEEAGLWTDGRYFIQAEKELADTGIRLFRMQEEGVPDIFTYLADTMWEGQVLGFDGRCVSGQFGSKLQERLSGKRIRLQYQKDLVEMIWQERPAFPCSRAEILPTEYCGNDVSEKLSMVREKMKSQGADCFFLSKLDDLMWLFNLRGNDVACNPVLMSYGFITDRDAFLFLQKNALQQEAVTQLKAAGVKIWDYHSILSFLTEYLFEGNAVLRQEAAIYGEQRRNAPYGEHGMVAAAYKRRPKKQGKLLYDLKNISYTFYCLFEEYGNCIVKSNPTEALKAKKTESEMSYIRDIYLKDSVAVTKYIYWLKNIIKQPETALNEYTAGKQIDLMRKQIPEFLDISFSTICAYMGNAAMAHYKATETENSAIKAEGMLLVDSGGQYLGGTTDVTRTIILGEISEEMKSHFTAVAAGMLRLAGAKFLYGCTGRNLDILAREALWEKGLDYKHGTGHGIGYMLNVHEGPHNIRWQYAEDSPEAFLDEGMIVSDEPGIYLSGKYGIRTENILEVKKMQKNENGQFMEFAHLTYVPIDLDGILVSELSEKEKSALNQYHMTVFEKISPYLTEEEKAWLATATRLV